MYCFYFVCVLGDFLGDLGFWEGKIPPGDSGKFFNKFFISTVFSV